MIFCIFITIVIFIEFRIAHVAFKTVYTVFLAAYTTYTTIFAMVNFLVFVVIKKHAYFTIVMTELYFTVLTLLLWILYFVTQFTFNFFYHVSVHLFYLATFFIDYIFVVTKSTIKPFFTTRTLNLALSLVMLTVLYFIFHLIWYY